MNKIIEQDLNKVQENLKEFEDKIKGKTFLITGGAGFIGSWFCDVVDRFGGRIICIDNLSSGSKKNIEHLIGKDNFVFVEDDMLNYEHKEKTDYVIHMASIATPPIYMKYSIETLDSNILGIRKMLEIVKQDKARRFLFTSTSEVYGDPPDEEIPTKETFYGLVNSYGPRCMYDEGKRAAEAYCYSYFQRHKLPIRIARIFNTYGPRLDVASTSQYGRALIKFVHQAINNNPITIYGDGKQTRSFCYITDQLTGLFKLLLTPGIDGEVINIGNSGEFTILELANKAIKLSGSNSEVSLNSPANYNLKDDPRRRCANIEKAKEKLNYSSQVKLDEGLKRVITWMKSMRGA